MEPACLEDVAGRLQSIKVPLGEYVVRAGEPGDAMYFIHAGSVQVLVETVPVDVLGAGGFFGEVALTASEARSADVMSLGSTNGVRCDPGGSPLGRRRPDPAELFRLTRADFEAVAERYPVLEERLHEIGLARVRRACSPHCSPLRALRRCSSMGSEVSPGGPRRCSGFSMDSEPWRGVRRCSSLSVSGAVGLGDSPSGSQSIAGFGRTPSASPAIGRRASDLPSPSSAAGWSPSSSGAWRLCDLPSPSSATAAGSRRMSDLPSQSPGASPAVITLGLPPRRMSDFGSPATHRLASPAPPTWEPSLSDLASPALRGNHRRMSDILIDEEDGEGSLDSWRTQSQEADPAEDAAEGSCLESLRFLWGAGPPKRTSVGSHRSCSPLSQRSCSPGSHRSGSPTSRRSGSPTSRSSSPLSRVGSPMPVRGE